MVYTNSYEVKLKIRTQNYIFVGFIFLFHWRKIYTLYQDKNELFSEWNMIFFFYGIFVKVKINHAL